MADQNQTNNDSTVLHRIDGRGVMLKVKQALEIGKMCFSFVQYGPNNKMTNSIDCFMSAEDFGLLMAGVRNGSLAKKIVNEKARAAQSGEQYPKAVWESKPGGKKTSTGAISRHFNISPGSSAEVLFTGIVMPATVSNTGAFIPQHGVRATYIRVPATFHDLALMAYKWQWLEKDYMSKRYSMEAMRDTYDHSHGGQMPQAAAPQSYGQAAYQGQPAGGAYYPQV